MATELFQVAFDYEMELKFLQEDLESLKKANTWAMACADYHLLVGKFEILRRVYVMKNSELILIHCVMSEAYEVFHEKIKEFCE